MPQAPSRTAVLTLLALANFAANSLIGRFALGGPLIDAAGYTGVRVTAAAVSLSLIVLLRRGRLPQLRHGDWRASLMLFLYAVFFSFAYLKLTTGTGALILFGAVQFTMFAVALSQGDHFPPAAWGGLAVAVAGVIWLVLPGLTAPDPLGALLMAISGVAWGFYTLLARGVKHPVETNAVNFLGCVPLAALVCLFWFKDLHAEPMGIAAAVLSGAVTSGIGYALWYAALKGLAATRAATIQLSVPAIAAFAGVAFLGEHVTLRLVGASALVLGGVAIVLTRRARNPAG